MKKSLTPSSNIPVPLKPTSISWCTFPSDAEESFKIAFLILSIVLMMWATGVRFTSLHVVNAEYMLES